MLIFQYNVHVFYYDEDFLLIMFCNWPVSEVIV